MELTSKQRAQLRGLANDIDTIVHVGKDGIGDNLVKQVSDALEARELIKVQVLKNAPYETREACGLLCDRLGASPVQCIGRRFTIFRRNEDEPKIEL